MNKLESFVYNAVKNNPLIKFALRNAYQGFFDLLPNKKDFSKNPLYVKENFFFGFHDVSPFDSTDQYLLANHLLIPKRMPKPGEELEVGLFKKADDWNAFQALAKSTAWNYHKGCRLQWLGKDKLIFNDHNGDQLVSQVYSKEGEHLKTVDYPMDAVSKDGKWASSFSYERLEHLMGGYGYPYEDGEAFIEEKFPENTGLYLLNIENNSRRLLLSIAEMKNTGVIPEQVMDQTHFVTHTLFSPDGRYLSFLHRSVNRKSTLKRWSRLLVFDLETNSCHVAPTDDMVSHYVWNELNQIIAYCRVEGIDSHVLFETPTLETYKRVAFPRLNSDGHQSFASNTSFVTDTYPDKWRMANLYMVHVETEEVELIARLNSFKRFQSIPNNHWACDLHPRMNNAGDMVCFDSVHTGKRALCFMPV